MQDLKWKIPKQNPSKDTPHYTPSNLDSSLLDDTVLLTLLSQHSHIKQPDTHEHTSQACIHTQTDTLTHIQTAKRTQLSSHMIVRSFHLPVTLDHIYIYVYS